MQINKEYFTTTDLAKLLRISRVAVFKKIKSGQIKAEKFGRNYLVRKSDLREALGAVLSDHAKISIDKTVRRAVKDYGETFKMLGKE